jgi:hypothetical protein
MVVKLVSGGPEPPESSDFNLMVRDLYFSGLTPDDINARVMENPERAATLASSSTRGYVIPYFDAQGKLIPFYRVRLFDADSEYKQPKGASNHVYFPKAFHQATKDSSEEIGILVITTGEKNAARATKLGFPAVAIGDEDAWRNASYIVSGDSALSAHRNELLVQTPKGTGIREDYKAPLAVGLLVDVAYRAMKNNTHLVIVYDSSTPAGPSDLAQTAAFELGCELRSRGVPYELIHQVILPWNTATPTTRPHVSLSDFLSSAAAAERFRTLLSQVKSRRNTTFPRHPSIVDYINRRLERPKLPRGETAAIALSILSDLDSRGIRLRAPTYETFYFDYERHKLLKSAWTTFSNEQIDAPFTQYLHNTYGLYSIDHRLLSMLANQFTSTAPIESVTPHRVFARPHDYENSVYYQLSDSEFVEVTAGSITVHANGVKGVLFEADQVDSLDTTKLLEAINAQSKAITQKPPDCWWAATLSQVRLRDKDKQRIVAALLYYMSPWLLRWRGMQLPVELIVGESGSGKSTLCELRLEILSGRPLLRNTPTDLKDWHASVTNTGGLHVTDNAQLVDRGLRQKLSDEICRIVTEPNPFIEQRKYYTNADLIRIPVRAVFAITAIQQPFQNADLLQRAFILELDKSIDIDTQEGKVGIIYDSNWKSRQLERFGGREAWIAHHLIVLQRFFQLVDKHWSESYPAKNRLINFEQAILLMADVFGNSHWKSWIPDFLVSATDRSVSEADWVLEGLQAFAQEHNIPNLRSKRFRAAAISDWCETQSDYKSCEILTNHRKLGRYMQAHKSAIYQLTGIAEAGVGNNRVEYHFRSRTPERRS